jgi:hypothetical protein
LAQNKNTFHKTPTFVTNIVSALIFLHAIIGKTRLREGELPVGYVLMGMPRFKSIRSF